MFQKYTPDGTLLTIKQDSENIYSDDKNIGDSMKTSLLIDDRVFADAKKEAERSGQTISEVISKWSQMGRDLWKQQQREPRKAFKARDLGKAKLDLTRRKDWMEALEDDRD